tara:strand:+ start:2578 stop:3294 length:717 start_codon:yes stop_codon:yes gene_type:complete
MITSNSENYDKKPLLKPSNLELIITGDGSSSLFNTELNDFYHSTKGAIGESLHVYIEQGLDYFIKTNPYCKNIKLFEIGFGTGLNALLTINWAQETLCIIDYESLETHPLPEAIYTQLQFKDLSINLKKIHQCEWEISQKINKVFKLTKRKAPLEKFNQKANCYDMIFFDAFSPSKQPNIWHQSNLKKCFISLKKNGFLVTYCSQGQFKRDLKEIGFKVDTLPGAMGKWEMVRAQKIN